MQNINLDTISLIIFGDYSVLTNTPFRDHQPLHMLPGHAEYCAWLRNDRYERGMSPLQFAVAGNKGGRAWNKHTEDEGREELRWTAEQIGTTHYEVCFACPTCAPGNEEYTTPEMLARRKPEPAMFRELAEHLKVPFKRVLIVDHFVDGYRAAMVLGMSWQSPGTFFAEATKYITTTATPVDEKDELELASEQEGEN